MCRMKFSKGYADTLSVPNNTTKASSSHSACQILPPITQPLLLLLSNFLTQHSPPLHYSSSPSFLFQSKEWKEEEEVSQ